MSTIEQSIDVNVPVHTAYNQWTQFEEFPRFMEGVEEVRQLDERRLHWRPGRGVGRGHHGTAPGRADRLEKYDRRDQRGGGDVPSARRQQDTHHAPNGV